MNRITPTLLFVLALNLVWQSDATFAQQSARQVDLINHDWRFKQGDPANLGVNLDYDVRPEITDRRDDRDADTRPTEAVDLESSQQVLKSWILPTGNPFIADPAKRHIRPYGDPGADVSYVQNDYDDSDWELVDLPHDWAIEGPWITDGPYGGMGRLPSWGIGWYRKELDIPASDSSKSIFLDVDGAMSYATVWLNEQLVGGWPFGYSSWRVDLTPYVEFGGENQLVIRLDNPPSSSRWYPGGGLYRNVWLVKTDPVHVGHWGTFLTTPEVSDEAATVNLAVTIDNDSDSEAELRVETEVFELGSHGLDSRVRGNDSPTSSSLPRTRESRDSGVRTHASAVLDSRFRGNDENGGYDVLGDAVSHFPTQSVSIRANGSATVQSSVTIENPQLWGPPPTQEPNLYVAVTTLYRETPTDALQEDTATSHTAPRTSHVLDRYTTTFGIRDVTLDSDRGLFLNGEHIYIQGVNQHHDLGALGAAFNIRAAERQLEILREMGTNAIRMAHNPPAPELLDLTDRLGFLVVDESFDVWERKKTPLDFHLIFPDWHEQDMRALVRRDRNHPSVIMWSVGNEVGEQYTDSAGAAVARRLHDIVKEEDPTRPTTASMNWAKPHMPFAAATDVINLNYQGEGIRNAPAYAHLEGINTPPLYPAFHEAHPDKLILSSENAAAVSSRGTYVFPVHPGISAPVSDSTGGDPVNQHVSAYELYTAPFGSSADKVFRSLEQHPYVGGGFVWSGWDYLGEPTPYYGARSSYFGVIDLAGFPKDRFYLYQSHWRPDHPMAHILPHWTWPERVGEVTPVHVFTSGDEAELFLNGESLGRKKKGEYEYRLRWDDVTYTPGTIEVVAYKDGAEWARNRVETAGPAARLEAEADRTEILADGYDLSFITVRVVDAEGRLVPRADNVIQFSVEGPGEIVATDNGDPTNFAPFTSHEREAFNGLALAIVRAKRDKVGTVTVTTSSDSLTRAAVQIRSSD